MKTRLGPLDGSFLLAFSVAAISCGDSGGGVSDETLDELGQAGYDALCDEVRDQLYDMYASSLTVQGICTALAIESTSTAADCADAIDECLSNPPPAAVALLDQILAQASCSAVSVDPAGCDEPVARVTSCLDALDGEVSRIQFTGTCALAGQPVDDSWWQFGLPSECSSISGDC